MKEFRQSVTDPAFVQDPYPFYARLRAAGPIVRWPEAGGLVATTRDAVDTLLRDRRFGRARADGSPPDYPEHLSGFAALEAHSLLELEPPRHTQLRKLVLRAFTSRRVAALAPEIEALAETLIDALPEGPFDLLPHFAERLPATIIARLIGAPDADVPDLLAWSHAMVAVYRAARTRAEEDAAEAAARAFAAYLDDLIAERRATPRDDLLSHLLIAEADGQKLSRDEVVSTAILLLNAGHEATVHALGNGVKALLETGRIVTAETAEATVEEILRYDPPLHLFTRTAYEDVKLFGHAFAPGDTVALLLGSACRDPDLAPDPDRFDPERAPAAHPAFGAGLHFCLGAPLARLEMRLALPLLFSRLPGLRLTEPPRYAATWHFHGLERLMVASDTHPA
ncbi:cytochrome P450 [Litorisediminicola beolgyonensis]|uniref:Cytochrome P450 n=1 Tax=Litorisediminicola beolgyonensis TaxID=1173614 RepID=A0ABW3ZFI9_9RHOB